jgi:predicted Zn-dependent protease
LEERLISLDRALAINLLLIEARDLKARLLAEAQRFEEALAVCNFKIEDEYPKQLMGRRVWIEKARGNQAEALRLVNSILDIDPQYEWGWYLMAQLCWEDDAAQDYFSAVEQLIRLDSSNSDYWEMLGQAHTWQGNRDRAKVAYQRAIDCAPENSSAGLTLFDLQWRTDEIEAAITTFRLISPNFSN